MRRLVRSEAMIEREKRKRKKRKEKGTNPEWTGMSRDSSPSGWRRMSRLEAGGKAKAVSAEVCSGDTQM